MDALERAKHLIKSANESEDIEGYLYGVQEAHAMAAIAQAEQLKRIGDMMAKWLEIQGVMPEYLEWQDRERMESE